ncbi:MAG TPA: efflux RND transporter permease subunit [Stellaceae bacterium]|nr:efflux RND transporter permease subunit [Stellaceae bacterium]
MPPINRPGRGGEADASLSEPFIRRPVATFLLTAGVMLLGLVAYRYLPVASVPVVDIPTIYVYASLPGASPETMASSVATPLERLIGQIPGVSELTSTSTLGNLSMPVQFTLERDIAGAARDVQAAITAAAGALPQDMPRPPGYYKINTSQAPILTLAFTSDSLPPGEVYDLVDTIVVPKLSQIPGVSQADQSGAEKTAIRVRLNPSTLAAYGIGLEDVRLAIAAANANSPKGSLEGPLQAYSIGANDQLFKVADFRQLIVTWRNGAAVRLGDLADIKEGVANSRNAAWFNRKRTVLVQVRKETDANVVETVDRVRAALPQILHWLPPSVSVDVLADRTTSIRAAIRDVQYTLALSTGLVILVMLLFLRRFWATVIPSVTIPVALLGTFAIMYVCGFSLDNLSLMALTVAVGFVVDDAIVMIENIVRLIEGGARPLDAALKGARQIGFTIVSITISLISAFVPILFLDGIIGRFFREFGVTLSAAVVVSAIVSLTLTPTMCAMFLGRDAMDRPPGRVRRATDRLFAGLLAGYERSLTVALRRRRWMLGLTFACVAGTIYLYGAVPKGFVPVEDTGTIQGSTEAAVDISFDAMSAKQQAVVDILMADPAVESVYSWISASYNLNNGYLTINLKPLAERKLSTPQVIDRLRAAAAPLTGISLFMQPVQNFGGGARPSKAAYQYTLQDPDTEELLKWMYILRDKLAAVPELKDVNSDRARNARQASLAIDRDSAARLGVSPAAIDQVLNDAFAQRQVATLYTELNQFKVVLEVDPQFRQDPGALGILHLPAPVTGASVPLSSVTRQIETLGPLAVYHHNGVAAATLSFNLAAGVSLGQAVDAIHRVERETVLPPDLTASFQGDAKTFRQSNNSQVVLLLAAIIGVYVVLGMLYESFIHPLTILSTIPSAGLGALLALLYTRTPLSPISMIGIILLVGIVKKNAIMMVDFALDAERGQGMKPADAIFQACLLRFRPIMMTTMAALLGALPIAIGTGAGSELRQPLGIATVGGLIVSQMLTLYTTPVVYLYLARLSGWRARRRTRRGGFQAAE